MDISGIEQISSIAQSNLLEKSFNTKVLNDTGADFSKWLANELATANQQIKDADTKLREFAVGKTDNLHEVMMTLSKAKSSFELVVEVRNRVLEGYQKIMQMSI